METSKERQRGLKYCWDMDLQYKVDALHTTSIRPSRHISFCPKAVGRKLQMFKVPQHKLKDHPPPPTRSLILTKLQTLSHTHTQTFLKRSHVCLWWKVCSSCTTSHRWSWSRLCVFTKNRKVTCDQGKTSKDPPVTALPKSLLHTWLCHISPEQWLK